MAELARRCPISDNLLCGHTDTEHEIADLRDQLREAQERMAELWDALREAQEDRQGALEALAVAVARDMEAERDAAITDAAELRVLAEERLNIIHNVDLGLQALLKTPANKPHSIERQWCVDLSVRLAQATPPAEAQKEGD